MQMTEKRFTYVRTQYRHYIQDVEKDGEWREGYRGTYDEYDLKKICGLLNALHEENINLKQALWEAEVNYYGERCDNILDYEGWIEDLKEDWDREYWNE